MKVREYDGKFFLINSGFPFNCFKSFSILYDRKTEIRAIELVKIKPMFQDFTPEVFIGSNVILYINKTNKMNKMKILYQHPTLYIDDYERVTKKYKNITVIDNVYFRSLNRDDTAFNCCSIL